MEQTVLSLDTVSSCITDLQIGSGVRSEDESVERNEVLFRRLSLFVNLCGVFDTPRCFLKVSRSKLKVQWKGFRAPVSSPRFFWWWVDGIDSLSPRHAVYLS
jgi:hypothetical protein